MNILKVLSGADDPDSEWHPEFEGYLPVADASVPLGLINGKIVTKFARNAIIRN